MEARDDGGRAAHGRRGCAACSAHIIGLFAAFPKADKHRKFEFRRAAACFCEAALFPAGRAPGRLGQGGGRRRGVLWRGPRRRDAARSCRAARCSRARTNLRGAPTCRSLQPARRPRPAGRVQTRRRPACPRARRASWPPPCEAATTCGARRRAPPRSRASAAGVLCAALAVQRCADGRVLRQAPCQHVHTADQSVRTGRQQSRQPVSQPASQPTACHILRVCMPVVIGTAAGRCASRAV